MEKNGSRLLDKEFKTVEQQINLLKSKNLTINNTDIAKDILENNNYYYLINGYKKPFVDRTSKTEKFINGTTIEEILNLTEILE